MTAEGFRGVFKRHNCSEDSQRAAILVSGAALKTREAEFFPPREKAEAASPSLALGSKA